MTDTIVAAPLPDLERHMLKYRPRTLPPVDNAKAAWLLQRLDAGFFRQRPLLAAPDANMKVAKNEIDTYSLVFSQDRTSGWANTCRFSTEGCRNDCVGQNGHGLRPQVVLARSLRVKFALQDPGNFLALLHHECERVARLGARIRLNTFSDIAWERVLPELSSIPGFQAYDYTKNWKRSSKDWYRLTFSVSEKTKESQIVNKLEAGERVAIVYPHTEIGSLPPTWRGFPVVNGDEDDDRWSTPAGSVVALYAKGKMRSNTTGFVRSLKDTGSS